MFGFFKQFEILEELNILEKKLDSSRLNGKQECSRCGFCCKKRPCILTPGEIVFLAKHFNMHPLEFIITYCTIDTNGSDYYPKLAGLNSQRYIGKFLINEASWREGACIFLEDKGHHKTSCKLNIGDFKPLSADMQKCWVDEEFNDDVRNQWKNDVLLKKYGINGNLLEFD